MSEPTTSSAAPRRRGVVVDDQPLIGFGLQRMMGDDFDVDLHEDAELALKDLSQGKRWDAILCDVMMPEVDGVEFHERLLAIDAGQAGRTLFMSGGGYTPRTEAFLKVMKERVLEKPFTPEQLRERLEQVFQRSSGA